MLFIPQLVVEVIQITLLVTGTLILLGTVLYGVKQQAEAKKVTVKIIKTMIATWVSECWLLFNTKWAIILIDTAEHELSGIC